MRTRAGDPTPWTERRSAIPVLGLDASFAEDGALVAIGPSPYEEGRVAAELALTLLSRHVAASSLGVRRSGEYVVALGRRAMARRHFELPEIYGALA